MPINDIKPNSHRFKEEEKDRREKKVERVVSGKVKTKKKNEIRKFADVFLAEDIESVKSYIFLDVVVPYVKKTIEDVIHAVLYGESGQRKNSSTASKVSYRNYYDKEKERNPVRSNRTKTGYDYDDIILDNRGEAEEVISRMEELIATYGVASVADLFDLVDLDGRYTDNKYGWTDLRSASAVKVREGWLLKLPKALPLD